MSSELLKELISVGHDMTATKYYTLATTALFFYDYVLTLEDELRYAWSGKKSWVFGLFLANRYLPMAYQFWLLILCYRPKIPQLVCNKTAFVPILAFVGCTLLAQVALTLRLYAITRKNHIITACFGVITLSQLALGTYFTAATAMEGAQQVPPIPFEAYTVCLFKRHWRLEVGFTAISLFYDFLAFSLIVSLAARSNMFRSGVPSLLGTIARDATIYFMVIFTSHLVLELTLIFGRPTVQLLPATGNVVYLPVMITRLMLSLKKAAVSEEDLWSFGESSAFTRVKFARTQGRETPGDEVGLDGFRNGVRDRR